VRYDGRGLLTWHPEQGFHLTAFLRRTGVLPETITFGASGLVPRSHVRTIRMRFSNGDRGIAPSVGLIDRFDLVNEDRLSLNLSRVSFFRRLQRSIGIRPGGSALYSWNGRVGFPDVVSHETFLGGERVTQNHERRGMHYEDDVVRLQGLRESDERAELNWVLKEPAATRAMSWRWSDALRYALAVTGSTTVQTQPGFNRCLASLDLMSSVRCCSGWSATKQCRLPRPNAEHPMDPSAATARGQGDAEPERSRGANWTLRDDQRGTVSPARRSSKTGWPDRIAWDVTTALIWDHHSALRSSNSRGDGPAWRYPSVWRAASGTSARHRRLLRAPRR
jgi:hypothetical protein